MRTSQMKQKEEKILGTLAIIFGALALLGSWLPIISILAFFFAIVAIALGVFGIGLNLNNRKTLAIIGTSLGILSIFLVLMTQVLPSGVFTDLTKNFQHPYRSLTSITEDEEFGNLPDYKSDEDKNDEDNEDTDTFSWTQEQTEEKVAPTTKILSASMDYQILKLIQPQLTTKLKKSPIFPLVQVPRQSYSLS